MLTSQQMNALSRAFRVGKGMTATEALALDAELPGGEQQLEARVTLCGFHRRAGTCVQAVGALARHVAWLATSWLPELPLARRDLPATETVLALLGEIDPDLALAGLERVRGAMPDTRWWRARGDMLLAKSRARREGKRELAVEAHAAYQEAWTCWVAEQDRTRKQYDRDPDHQRRTRLLHALELAAPFTRIRLLAHLLEAAFEADLTQEAGAHLAALEPLIAGPVASVAAEAQHRAEVARGRLALHGGDEVAATRHLLESTAPLAQALLLRYSGPDLALAEALLARGHRATVTEFLERAEAASVGLCPRLTHIRQAVEQGDDPDWAPTPSDHDGR